GPTHGGCDAGFVLSEFCGFVPWITAGEHGACAQREQAHTHQGTAKDTTGYDWLHGDQAPAIASLLSCTTWPTGSAPNASSALCQAARASSILPWAKKMSPRRSAYSASKPAGTVSSCASAGSYCFCSSRMPASLSRANALRAGSLPFSASQSS